MMVLCKAAFKSSIVLTRISYALIEVDLGAQKLFHLIMLITSQFFESIYSFLSMSGPANRLDKDGSISCLCSTFPIYCL